MAQPSQRGELAVRAVVMECRIRLCATPARIDAFVLHALRVVSDALPGRVFHSHRVSDIDSKMLVRQWNGTNSSTVDGSPRVVEVEFAFAGTDWLNADRLETLSRDILSDIAPRIRGSDQEVVPWILTIDSQLDDAAHGEVMSRHPNLRPTLAAVVS